MHISKIHIQNYRRLKSTSIEIEEERTMFVGANNSGKTSAMQALISFLSPSPLGGKPKFNVEDITLSNWTEINELGLLWLNESISPSLEDFRKLMPTLDVWFEVDEDHLFSVVNMIPTLSWKGGKLGVRIVLQPESDDSNPLKDQFKRLVSGYKEAYKKARKAESDSDKVEGTLSPMNLGDFLQVKGLASKYFKLVYYILDSEKYGDAEPQDTLTDSIPNPLLNIIHVDCIYAQRGFNDPNHASTGHSNLTSQFVDYKSNHLDTDDFNGFDVDAIEAMKDANQSFDKVTNSKFEGRLNELSSLNVPGWGNPKITLRANLDYFDGLNHDAAVQFQISRTDESITLSEKYSGLGYQNLVSISFSLLSFRDAWLKKREVSGDVSMPPIHLVLIEEPEAHLHAQAQRVFIREAYKLLRNHEILGKKKDFVTQLLFSTHSNDIVHEIPFSCLRYFKRCVPSEDDECSVPTSIVVNLSCYFDEISSTRANATMKKKFAEKYFVAKYIKYTHSNIFFADALILIEGKAESLVMPKFLETIKDKEEFAALNDAYLSILEVGGAHMHKFKDLLDYLGLRTLIVTDLDPVFMGKGTTLEFSKEYQFYLPDKGYTTSNTIISDLAGGDNLDEVLKIPIESPEKLLWTENMRIVYQYQVEWENQFVYPTTFEDAFVVTNKNSFSDELKANSVSLFNKMLNSISSNPNKMMGEMHYHLHKGKAEKGDMAIQILLFCETIEVPNYILDGFIWLNNSLKK